MLRFRLPPYYFTLIVLLVSYFFPNQLQHRFFLSTSFLFFIIILIFFLTPFTRCWLWKWSHFLFFHLITLDRLLVLLYNWKFLLFHIFQNNFFSSLFKCSPFLFLSNSWMEDICNYKLRIIGFKERMWGCWVFQS